MWMCSSNGLRQLLRPCLTFSRRFPPPLSVITSYSIHYTKLYDAPLAPIDSQAIARSQRTACIFIASTFPLRLPTSFRGALGHTGPPGAGASLPAAHPRSPEENGFSGRVSGRGAARSRRGLRVRRPRQATISVSSAAMVAAVQRNMVPLRTRTLPQNQRARPASDRITSYNVCYTKLLR